MGDLDVDLPIIKEVNLKNSSSVDFLVRAVRTGDVDTVKNLLSSGVDPNTKASDGAPVIWTATNDKHQNIVAVLLRAGADPNAFNKKTGTSVLDNAIRMAKNSDDGNRIVALLLKYGARCSAEQFNELCYNGNYTAVKSLLDSGVTPYRDSLWAAGRFTTPENIKVMELLLQAGADPNAENMYGETMLQRALKWDTTKDIIKRYIATLRKYGAK